MRACFYLSTYHDDDDHDDDDHDDHDDNDDMMMTMMMTMKARVEKERGNNNFLWGKQPLKSQEMFP